MMPVLTHHARLGLAIGLLFASACSPTVPSPVVLGVWGGDHIRLEVTALGAAAEYDCAHGTIDEPLRVDAQGRFSAQGTHTFEHGGPIRIDEPIDRHPARYEGQLSGDTLQIAVTVIDQRQALGPYVVKLDRAARLVKCL